MKTEKKYEMPVSVLTLDGETVEPDKALSLNYTRLGLMVKFTDEPVKGQIRAMRQVLCDRSSTAYAVSSEATEKAKEFTALIESVKFPKSVKSVPSIWVPFKDAYEKWVAYRTQKDEEAKKLEAKPDDKQAKEDPVAAMKARVEEQTKKRSDLAAGFAKLIPNDIVTQRDDDRRARQADRDAYKADRDARQARRKLAEEKLGPLLEGMFCVSTNARPTGIVLKENGKTDIEYAILDFAKLAERVKDGVEAEHVHATCSICGKESSLGATTEIHKKGEDGKDATITVLVMNQIKVDVRTEKGEDVYCYMVHDDETGKMKRGNPKPVGIAICGECGSVAKRMSDGKVQPKWIIRGFLSYLAKRQDGSAGGGSVYHDSASEGKPATIGASIAADPKKKEDIDELLESLPVDRSEPDPSVSKFDKRQARTAKKQAAMVASAVLGDGQDKE